MAEGSQQDAAQLQKAMLSQGALGTAGAVSGAEAPWRATLALRAPQGPSSPASRPHKAYVGPGPENEIESEDRTSL